MGKRKNGQVTVRMMSADDYMLVQARRRQSLARKGVSVKYIDMVVPSDLAKYNAAKARNGF